MTFNRLSRRALVFATGLCMAFAAASQGLPAAKDEPYLGPISLQVDATDLDRKIFRVRETLPARAGRLTLLYPRWIPGHHGPTADAGKLAGLRVTAGGAPLAWTRDAVEPHVFHVDVPQGVSALQLEFEHLSPVTSDTGRVTMTREMLGVQWHTVLLYPAGHAASRIEVAPSLKLPAGWQHGTALRPDPARPAAEGWTHYRNVSVETLVDSPVFAGRHFRRVELEGPASRRPVALNMMGDEPSHIAATVEQLNAHRQLVLQSDRLFGARHFAHYDFLLAMSDSFGGIGLEHHQSSENGVKPGYFKDWGKAILSRELLPHEYVHSWNGKFRRPAELTTDHYNEPMRDSLLWVYEGQTQYWGNVLTVRSGLASLEQARDGWATIAAWAERRAGRQWRNLQDTTQEAIIGWRAQKDWADWQRGADYYDEAALVWLDADTLIRERSGGRKSLDDFARAFFGVEDGRVAPLTYTFDDVVKALNGVLAHDWAGFLRERLDNHEKAPLDGLARGGWKLVYTETPSEFFKAEEADAKRTHLNHSIGLSVDNGSGKVTTVNWDSPAWRAGVAPGATLVAVNLRAFKPEVLKDAITAAKDGRALELLLKEGDNYRIVRIDYRGGLRYPKLERLPGTEDRLSKLLAPR